MQQCRCPDVSRYSSDKSICTIFAGLSIVWIYNSEGWSNSPLMYTVCCNKGFFYYQINFNEPLSFLQRLTEEFEYSDCLDNAAKCDQWEQMCWLAAFTISAYSTTTTRTGKPFNPLLGETFEFDRRDDLGWRSITEQVLVPNHCCCADNSSVAESSIHCIITVCRWVTTLPPVLCMQQVTLAGPWSRSLPWPVNSGANTYRYIP